MTEQNKTHFRKHFKSCYLAAVDITEEIELTISRIVEEMDASKKTKDKLLVAYFKESEIRKGERLKPMVINATNAKTINRIANSPFIEDWAGVSVVVYVDDQVRFGRDIVEGLRLKAAVTKPEKPLLTPESANRWANAVKSYQSTGNLDKVKERMQITPETEALLIEQATAPQGDENVVA